jgi:hypothetical protein
MTPRPLLPAVLMASLLSACAPAPTRPNLLQPYVAPTSGKIAKLQLRSPRLLGTALLYSFDNARTCSSPQLISDSRKRGGVFQESSTILADGPRTLWYIHSPTAGSVCSIMLSFSAVADKNYAVFMNALDSSRCSLSVLDITDPANPKPERQFSRSPSPASVQSGVFCQTADVDAELLKPRKLNRSGLQMTDLKEILPPAPTAAPATTPTKPGAPS